MTTSPQRSNPQLPRNNGQAHSSGGIWTKFGLAVALGIGLCYWTIRGPIRALDRLIDFPTFYSASRAWLSGGNPYDGKLLQSTFDAAGGGEQTVLLSVNPPGLFPLVAPLALLPYRAAQILIITLSILALAATVLLIAHLAGIKRNSTRFALLLIGCLFLSPVHTSISQGQLTLLTCLGLTAALWAELNRKDILVGIALAVAVSFKPQMVILFGPYYLLKGRWRVCASGLSTTLGLLGLSIAWMGWHGIDWWASWMANIEALTQSPITGPDATGTGNLQVMGKSRYIMTNAAPLLYEFTHQRTAVSALVWTPVAACLGWLGYAMPKRITQPGLGFGLYACLGLLCLLTFYNRTYCLVTLLLVLGLALSNVKNLSTKLRITLALLLCPLIIPGAAVLLTLEGEHLREHWITESWAWQWVLYPHWIYLQIVVLAILMKWVSPEPTGKG